MNDHTVPKGFDVPMWQDPAEVAVAQAAYDFARMYADESGQFAALGYQPEWVQEYGRYLLEVKQRHGVCRHPHCLRPADWTGANLTADPNAGGWCEHHA